MRTPNLDRLAQTGTRFRNHFTAAPAPAPGRATLLTSRTPMQLGEAGVVSSSDVPLDKILEGLGYVCQATDSGGAAQFLDHPPAGKSFFLTVSLTSLRPPYDGVAQEYRDLYAQAKFDCYAPDPVAANAQRGKEMLSDILGNVRKVAAAVTALDDDVATLLSRVRQRGLFDNTLVIFTSACGSLLGRHGLWDSAEASAPSNMYDEAVVTPMLWSWPGHVPAQAVRPEMVSSYDLVPTICDLVSTAAPNRNLCGRSYLLPATGKPLPKKQPWRTTVCAHHGNTDMAREQRYKLVTRDAGKGPNELYDLPADPRERANQYENQQYLTVRTTLQSALSNWKEKYSA